MADELAARITACLRPVPDYPRSGILFQDITPVLADGGLLRDVIAEMARPFADAGVTHVVAIEARGFILGGAVADRLGAGLVPARKPGKLPWVRTLEPYDLEYGTDALEMHEGMIEGARVLIVDDVLATGGTAAAAGRLTRRLGATLVGWSFLLELGALGGRKRLAGAEVRVLAGR